ncbi:hypothetical protein BX286_2512 [Streptomyces sp. 3211.6]|uniref:SCO2400 family protein n=1 Tax=Streptomyces sp. 3211.6 TaxID=1938845 RepID=UPI000EB563F2|nr:hypothetical protein [Streptomyces sp. 3211.6]RKT04553.1 hypothetical protein BX286_2512 [Streptomyces sp. 3211.6]
MNYFCPDCQRHLNGALACAGCGTPAEYLVAAAPAAPAGAHPGPEPQPALAEVFADSLVVLTAPHEGRAGTRKRAASRRRRGRTTMAVGLGLLLATGGSIAVARIAGDDGGVNRADRVELTDSGPAQPDALPSAAPAAPSALPKGAGGAAKTARPSGSPSGSAQASPSGSASAPTGSPSQKGSGGEESVKTTPPGTPSPRASGTAQPPTARPTPKPKPQPTDTCVLWIFC